MTISPSLLYTGGQKAVKKDAGIRRRMNPESLAVRLGPDLVKELEKLGGAKVIVCMAPNPKAYQGLLPALAVDGTLLLLGITLDEARFNTGKHHFRTRFAIRMLTLAAYSVSAHEARLDPWLGVRHGL